MVGITVIFTPFLARVPDTSQIDSGTADVTRGDWVEKETFQTGTVHSAS